MVILHIPGSSCRHCGLLQVVWMPLPSSVPTNCPPGLEYLTQIDQILVNQQIEILECECSVHLPAVLMIMYVVLCSDHKL